MSTLTVDERQVAAILAGLQALRNEMVSRGRMDQAVYDIMSDVGNVNPLDHLEVDALMDDISYTATHPE